ncbi:MAG: Crp/Fnr family transcriptional regulator [Chitinophagaceae bacterium]|nr:Crp/Fnr family transcriptional regulator [Chitinophagaceae bacterium]
MFDKLIKNLNGYLSFTEEEISFFLSLCEYKIVKKYDLALKVGQICDFVAYVNKGLLRYYYVAGDKEHTARIFLEDSWTSEYASFLCKKPSSVSIEALEETELIILRYDSVQRGYDKAKVFERFGRLMAEALFIDLENRNSDFLTKTPEERYLLLLQQEPEMFNRVPLKYIASMIGIEPESLSRIRKRTAGR